MVDNGYSSFQPNYEPIVTNAHYIPMGSDFSGLTNSVSVMNREVSATLPAVQSPSCSLSQQSWSSPPNSVSVIKPTQDPTPSSEIEGVKSLVGELKRISSHESQQLELSQIPPQMRIGIKQHPSERNSLSVNPAMQLVPPLQTYNNFDVSSRQHLYQPSTSKFSICYCLFLAFLFFTVVDLI
jgi:hypothetical protein